MGLGEGGSAEGGREESAEGGREEKEAALEEAV